MSTGHEKANDRVCWLQLRPVCKCFFRYAPPRESFNRPGGGGFEIDYWVKRKAESCSHEPRGPVVLNLVKGVGTLRLGDDPRFCGSIQDRTKDRIGSVRINLDRSKG